MYFDMLLEGSTKENIDELIYEAIETIRGKKHKIPNEFSICNYLNVNTNTGGLLLYVREDIPCKILKEYTPEKPIENLFVEINLRSRKWLLSCSYSPKTNLIADHLHCIGRGIDFYSSKYDNFIVSGDVNTEVSNSFMEQFCASCNLKSVIKEHTCFKSVDNTSCVDLILTNHPKSFQTKLWCL